MPTHQNYDQTSDAHRHREARSGLYRRRYAELDSMLKRAEKSRRRRRNLLLLATIVVAALATAFAMADVSGRVVAVTDGDTIKVLDANRVEHKIRLTGVDAPERGQPYGNASRKHLANLVAGKQVVVESDKADRYGRILGKVLVDGTDANLEQVKAGYAWWYRYYAKTQLRADRKSYEQAEASAKGAGLGLWADSNPINPYEWRKGKRQ